MASNRKNDLYETPIIFKIVIKVSLMVKSVGPTVIELIDIRRICRAFPACDGKLKIALAASNGLKLENARRVTLIIF